MRSCDIHNLQFESIYDDDLKTHIVKNDSIRLVCPKCGYEHTEDMKSWMNIHGGYIHEIPALKKEHPGYQFGALASQLPALNWKAIATAQLEAGKRSDIESQTTFDNSFRGLPFKRREVVKEDFERLKEHCWKPSEAPSLDNVEMVFLVADTQDDRSVVGIFALDVNDNLHLIEAKEPQYLFLSEEDRAKVNASLEQISKQKGIPFVKVETVEDLLLKEYLVKDGIGIKPTFALIDRQGHRTNDIQYFANKHPQVMMYQGSSMTQSNWRMSDNVKRLILASAKHYQANLIYYLYSQKKRTENYLYFMPNISADVIKQIVCVKPDSTKKFGDAPENWQPEHDGQHDWFDVLKMAYLAVDVTISLFRRDRWRFCKSPALKRRWEKVPVLKKSTDGDTKPVGERYKPSSWFS